MDENKKLDQNNEEQHPDNREQELVQYLKNRRKKSFPSENDDKTEETVGESTSSENAEQEESTSSENVEKEESTPSNVVLEEDTTVEVETTDDVPANKIEIPKSGKEFIDSIKNRSKNTALNPENDKDIVAITSDVTIEKGEDEDIEEDKNTLIDRFALDNIDSDEVEIEVDVESEKEDEVKKPDIPKSTPIRIGSTGDRKSVKRLTNLNPGPNIKVEDSEEYQRAVIEQYITGTKGSSFIGPKSVTRVVLPYSGIFYDISSYTNSEMLGIHRSTNDVSFVEKVEMELYSAWEHTVNNSFKRKLDFVEWLRNVMYPDLWCIYWGIYNVNHPGVNTYTSECDYCPNIIEEKRDNYSISYVSENSLSDITQDDVYNIRNGVDRELIRPYKIATTLIEKENYLPDRNFKIFHGIPNMEEVMTFLKYLKTDLQEDDETIRRVLYPISWLELERSRISKAAISKILAYKYSLFTRKVYVPVYEEIPGSVGSNGKPKLKATYVNVKSIMIPPLINDLSKEDFKELIRGKELRKIMVKDGIHFRVKDSVCPKCKKEQLITALDMRDIIFTRAAQMTEFLMNM